MFLRVAFCKFQIATSFQIFNIPPKINNHNGNNHKHHHAEDKTKKEHDHQHHHANDKVQNGPTTPRHDHHNRPPSVHHNKSTVNSKFKQKLRIVSSLIVSAMLKGKYFNKILSYFLKTNIKFYCIYQYCMSINSFFNMYLFLDTAATSTRKFT